MRRPQHLVIMMFLALFGVGCPPSPEPLVQPTDTPTPSPRATREPITDPAEAFTAVADDALPDLLDDGSGNWAELKQATRYSLRWMYTLRDTEKFTIGDRTVTARQMRKALGSFLGMLERNPSAETLAERIKADFDVYESVGAPGGGVLFTGYFEPMIEASLRKKKGYDTPIYRRPRDMVYVDLGRWDEEFSGRRIAGRIKGKKLVPYYTRKDIRARHRLKNKGLEMAWARDPIDVFFLEVQGSGTLLLPNGKEKRIGYAGSNGHAYDSIGRLLIDEGKVPREQMSMQAIRHYLEANPGDVPRVLQHNESFVFFHFLGGPPLGNLGQPVTPRRSIATDHRLLPRGALAFIETEHPMRGADGTVGSAGPLRRFVLNQDTGGAIKGPGRVDFFWGRGPEAREAAGAMQHPGRIFFFVPKSAAKAASARKPS